MMNYWSGGNIWFVRQQNSFKWTIRRDAFLSINKRRTVVKSGRGAKRSGLQVVQEVMSAWTSEEDDKVTALKLMAVYEAELGDKDTTGNANDDLDNADGAMRMSKYTIESSMHMSKYILSDNALKAMAFHAETLLRDKKPMAHHVKLETPCIKSKSTG